MLISEEYRQLNRKLHESGRYGQRGDRWAQAVQLLIDKYQPNSILDYGCGHGALGRHLGRSIAEYDPGIEGKEALPAPADLVVCTDVIEHIEPDCIDSVLDHLKELTRKCLFAIISTRPASKILADGRNAHLIVEPWEWWEPKIRARFRVAKLAVDPDEVRLLLTSLEPRS